MSVRIARNAAVDCHAVLELPLTATSVWGQLRDFHRFAQQDFFHAGVGIEGEMPRAGARLTLCHRYAGLRVHRIGRILVWREGLGYSFSDLSRRGPHNGFPHVFTYRIEPASDKTCRLHIRVRGKWTANAMPRWVAKLWLIWVFSHMVRKVRNDLHVYAIWRKATGSALA